MKLLSINRYKLAIVAVMMTMLGMLVSPLALSSVHAQTQSNNTLQTEACSALEGIGGDCTGSDGELNSTVKNIVNILLYVVGVVSVIMIIIGAIRFTTSTGDPQRTAGARNTILYALIGLVVAAAAFTIVNWVLPRIQGGSTPADTSNNTTLPAPGTTGTGNTIN